MKEINETLEHFIDDLRRREKKMGYKVLQTEKSIVNCQNSLTLALFKYIDGYCIKKEDREIVFKLAFLNNNYLQFAQIDNIVIVVDIQKTNEANEYNIINYETKYVITKTFESFFANKVWAWIDRKRTFWKEEIYQRKTGD